MLSYVWSQAWSNPLNVASLTAGFTSIDRFPQNTAPTFLFTFYGVGARHPGVAGVGSLRIAHPHYLAVHIIDNLYLI